MEFVLVRLVAFMEVGLYIIEVDWAMEIRNQPSLRHILQMRRHFYCLL
jgi:hypothetical protein